MSRRARKGCLEASYLSRANLPLTRQPRSDYGRLAYSMSLSCADGMRGGDGDSTSAPLTVA